jgi:energy-converting hydrogenase A subunit M
MSLSGIPKKVRKIVVKEHFDVYTDTKRLTVLLQTIVNSYLLESDVIGVLSETLTAHVETILANESMSVGTDAAKKQSGFFNS